MNYIDSEGREFELPKLTVAISEAIEEASDAKLPIRDRAAKQLAICCKCLPAGYVSETCDGKTVDTVDVTRLEALFHGVKKAYEGPGAEARIEAALAQLEAVAPLLEAAKGLNELPTAKSRQGFSRVR